MPSQWVPFVRRRLADTRLRIAGLCLLGGLACLLMSWAYRALPGRTPSPTRTPFSLPANQAGKAIPGQTLNLFISQAGAYQVTQADLLAAGMHLTAGDAQKLRITWRGQPVAAMLHTQGDDFSLRFYGQPSESRFSAQNIYQLQWGSPTHMPRAALPITDVAALSVYTQTIHREENLVYAPQATQVEGWFWEVMPAPSAKPFEVELTELSHAPARLRIGVWSNTQAEISPDHHMQARIAGELVLDTFWDGEGFQIAEAEIPAGVLDRGNNSIEISIPGDTGVVAERTYLDWIEIAYLQPAKAGNDLAAVPGAQQPIRVEGFDGPVTLWQIDSLTQTIHLQTRDASAGQITIPAGEGKQYLAIGAHGFATASIQPASNTPDLRKLPAADYLAIGPADLLEAIQPLLEQHEREGLQTVAIPLQAVYDQFNAGFPEPQAIQRFLSFAAQNWRRPPEYVLLLGDFTFDPRAYTAPPEANRLPSYFIHTYFGGETATDLPFAQLDGDQLPDIAIGRLPAREPAQVDAYVRKVLAYARQTDLGWRWRLLTVADGQEASFANDAQTFLAQFTTESFTKTSFTPAAGVTDANRQIDAYLQEGYGLVSYFGHGSVNMWGKDRLFTTDDVAALKNSAHLPVVINMNCLTGLFTHPQTVSLAEALLWQPEGGAIVVLAPTSLTLPSDQALLSNALVAVINSNPAQALGSSFLMAQRQMPHDWSGANEVLSTFLYFGDPALHPWK